MSLVATSADVDAILPGCSTAVETYSAGLLDEYLELAALGTAGDADVWGSGLARAQALHCLHLLSVAGILGFAALEDPGEFGVTQSRAAGLSGAVPDPVDELQRSRFGRILHELRTQRFNCALPPVSGTEYF